MVTLDPLKRRAACFVPLFFALNLTACSTFLPQSDTGEETASDSNLEQVIENLVLDASNLGEVDITNDNSGQVPEPVEPTVSMSANRVVEQAINDYLQNRQTLLRLWIERSHTYFPMIEQIFEEEDIPDELKYIALGESGLNPTARSWVGAAGMWQFMPATGRGAGLEINGWVDERRDPEKSTRAAAQHLKELYETYGHSWHLALAGYNCSYRCIKRAVRRAGGSIANPPSYWEIYPFLPRETRGFIPKFIAASLLVSNPEFYGISAETFGHELSYDVVGIQGMMELELAAELAGTSDAVLRTLNPELLKNSIPDFGEPYTLKIPVGSYERFVTGFDALPEESKVSPTEYIVKSGDTLADIGRRLDTTVAALQSSNNIRGSLIHPGQKLLIPGSGVSDTIRIVSTEPHTVDYGEATFQPIKLTEDFQLVELEGSTPESPMYAVSLSEEAAENDILMVPTIHLVRRGDTLGQIASRYQVSVSELQQWNGIRGNIIQIGQELTVHSNATTPATVYEVRRGDNLASIARRFGVSVDNIKRWNGLSNDMIYPGQNLTLN